MKRSFTQTPNAVIRSGKEISDAEFRLYCTLLSFDFKRGFVFPSRETLGKHMGASRAKIDRVKNSLEKKGAFRKQRRGQGITNLYFLNRDFLYKADDSNMSPLGNSPVSGKEDGVDNIFNNYLPTSSSFKETNFGGETQPLPEPQPLTKDKPEVIFRSLINRAIPIAARSIRLGENPEDFSEDIGLCAAGIRYYLRKYRVVLGIHHTLYKTEQVVDCIKGFLWGLKVIETSEFPIPKSEVMTRAIDRWFNTTETDPNNLQLNHFVGNYSNIFFNSVKGVGAEFGVVWGEDLC